MFPSPSSDNGILIDQLKSSYLHCKVNILLYNLLRSGLVTVNLQIISNFIYIASVSCHLFVYTLYIGNVFYWSLSNHNSLPFNFSLPNLYISPPSPSSLSNYPFIFTYLTFPNLKPKTNWFGIYGHARTSGTQLVRVHYVFC